MKKKLSLLMITKNCQKTIEASLRLVKDLADEIIVVDDYSSDNTVKIVQKYKAKTFLHHEIDLGKQRAYALKKCTGDWALVLDSDEVITSGLRKELKQILSTKRTLFDGFEISYKNHFLGKPLKHGGESYKKMTFFKRKKAVINPNLVHEKFLIKNGKVGCLKNIILHYSYQSLPQIFLKFTNYAVKTAMQKKANGERTSLKKIIFYPTHMLWARFIEDKGYKDGLFRLPLDIGFAYMEFLTYFLMLFK